MAKKHGVRLPGEIKDIKFPSREEMDRLMEDHRKAEEKRQRKEKKDRYKAFIRSGVKVDFSVRQVLWLIKHFSRADHEHWDGRVD